jgi:hypothetical protein
MGTIYTYRCNKCNYSVQTSGKLDYGMLAVTNTYICNSCKQIVDVLVGLRGETFHKEEIKIKKENNDEIYDFKFYSCPSCDFDDITEWDTKRKPCPKCDGQMRKGKNDEMLLWD